MKLVLEFKIEIESIFRVTLTLATSTTSKPMSTISMSI